MAGSNFSLKEDQAKRIVEGAGMEIRGDVDQPGKFLYFDKKCGDGSDVSFDSRGEALLACASDVVLYVKHAIGLDDDTWEPMSIEAKVALVSAVVKGDERDLRVDHLQMIAAGRTEIRPVEGEEAQFVFFVLDPGDASKGYPSYAEALSAAAFDIASAVMGHLNIPDEEWDTLDHDTRI